MPKCVRESSAVSGPECPAIHRTFPTRSSQSCASWLKSRISPYFRYENAPYVEHAPQKPLNSSKGSSARFTEAIPQATPEFVNSVICWGRSAPWTFVSRWYHPQPSTSPNPFMNPAMFVDSARSADIAMKRGRPYSARAKLFTQEPQVASAARFGFFSPGFAHTDSG